MRIYEHVTDLAEALNVPTDTAVFAGTYICPPCKKFFKTLEELKAHEESVHGTKR